MKNKIYDAFGQITDDSTIRSYHQMLDIIFAASRQSGCFDEVCVTIDNTIDSLLDLFEDECPASDQSE